MLIISTIYWLFFGAGNWLSIFHSEVLILFFNFVSSSIISSKDDESIGIITWFSKPTGQNDRIAKILNTAAGLGKKLIATCLAEAKKIGFTHVYLETMPELKKAVSVYEKFGFTYLQAPMGNTGHNGCDIWMLKEI